MKKKGTTNHDLLNKKWDEMVFKDHKTYLEEWLFGGYQNEELKAFLEKEIQESQIPGTRNNKYFQAFIQDQAREAEIKGEEFDPVKAANDFRLILNIESTKKFHDDVKEVPGVGVVSEADEVKWQFCIDPKHPNWREVIE